jgi:hypothetical protein
MKDGEIGRHVEPIGEKRNVLKFFLGQTCSKEIT